MLGQYRGVFQVHMFVPTRQEQGKRFRKAAEHASGKRRQRRRRVQFSGGGANTEARDGIKIAGTRGLARRVSVGQPRGRGKVSRRDDAEHPDKKSRDRDRFELHKRLCRDASSAAVRVTHAVWGYGIAELRSRSHVQSTRIRRGTPGTLRDEDSPVMVGPPEVPPFAHCSGRMRFGHTLRDYWGRRVVWRSRNVCGAASHEGIIRGRSTAK
ncbi:hypothetical protein TNCT_150221 [Trichonephila clavata]|uniref:Uncharacterized protein n=1 Tax=Trichonephila clavata TaxID=2740835 RepID=A0A8X6KZI1_TRICU|nr:hypothetical protein TNCT_150221 [Trichonephila clavata]